MMSSIAIIPARGGSKRIPRKNVRDFCGKPIIAWTIETALGSALFDRVVISTDDEEISSLARERGAEVPFIRPAELADDFTGTDAVFLHALNTLGLTTGIACCLYATAPFLQPDDLKRGRDVLITNNATTAFSVTRYNYPIFRALKVNERGRVEMIWPEHCLTRSQDLPDTWHDAGQFYWVDVAKYLVEKRLFSLDSCPVELPSLRVQDIDTEEDWKRAEVMFRLIDKGQQ